KYGGEVITRSIDSVSSGSFRASPCHTLTSGARLAPLKSQPRSTRFRLISKASNGLTGDRLNDLCGLLWDTSRASDTPVSFVIIIRERAHHRNFLKLASFTSWIARERA